MSRNAAALCDGLGARRAALTLAPPMVAGAGALALRPLRPDDEVCVLAWQQTPETRRYFRNPSPPTPAEHNAWMDARLSRKPNLTFVITVDGRAAGLLHLDPAPAAGTAPETFEVSILIAPEWHRRGIGKAALRLLHHTFTGAGFVAAVHPANEPSHRLFRSAGYRRQGDVYVYDAGPPTGTDRERFDDRHTSSRQTQGVSPSCSRP
jgi:L-amino acid N-acyltransferase YncA